MMKRSVWPDLPQARVCTYAVFTLPICRATHGLRQQKHRKKLGPHIGTAITGDVCLSENAAQESIIERQCPSKTSKFG